MYLIHEVSEKLDISIPSLHYYEREGLLDTIQRDYQNRRVYSDIDIEWIRMVQQMRFIGLPIANIKAYVSLMKQGPKTMPERLNLIRQYQQEIKSKIQALHLAAAWVDIKISFYEDALENKDTYKDFDAESKAIQHYIQVKNK